MALGFRSGGRFSLCWFPKQGCPTASSVLSVCPAHGLLHMRRSAVLADPVPVLVMWGSSAAHMLFPVIKILLQLVRVLTLIKICTAYKIGNRIPWGVYLPHPLSSWWRAEECSPCFAVWPFPRLLPSLGLCCITCSACLVELQGSKDRGTGNWKPFLWANTGQPRSICLICLCSSLRRPT